MSTTLPAGSTRRSGLRRSFTLLELILVYAILVVIVSIILSAVRPGEQLAKARDAKRLQLANQIQKALSQYVIDHGFLPDALKFPSTLNAAVPICSLTAVDTGSCINVSPLVPDYLADIPADAAETCGNLSGYAAYRDSIGPRVVPTHAGVSLQAEVLPEPCPVSIKWNGNVGTIRGGVASFFAPFDLQGRLLKVESGALLKLNGNALSNGFLTNSGTIIALGQEPLQTITMLGRDAGSWNIIGGGGSSAYNPAILASVTKNIVNLTFDSADGTTTYVPQEQLTVNGLLTIGANSILNTTSTAMDGSAFQSMRNDGGIILGNNADQLNFGTYDDEGGETVLSAGLVRSDLAYHDLVIGSPFAHMTENTTVHGDITVLGTQKLTLGADVTLSVKGNADVEGSVTTDATGTMDLGEGGATLTVGSAASLAGASTASHLILTATRPWTLQNHSTNSLSNVSIAYAQTSADVYCSQCTDLLHNSPNILFTDTLALDATPNAIAVLGVKAYVTTPSDDNQVAIIDGGNLSTLYGKFQAGSIPALLVATGSKVYVANYFSKTVSIYDTAAAPNARVVATPSVGNTLNPCGMTAFRDKVYVGNRDGGADTTDTVVLIDANGTQANTVTKTLPYAANGNAIGKQPCFLAGFGTKVYVANWNDTPGTVSVIDAGSHVVIARPTVGSRPRAFAAIGTKVYVANSDYADHTISVIDGSTNAALPPIVLGHSVWALTSVGTKLYAVSKDANVVDVIETAPGAQQNTVIASIPVESSPLDIALLGTRLYVPNAASDSVSIIETSGARANSVIATVGVGVDPQSVAVLGSNVFVANTESTFLSIIPGR